MGKRKKVLIYNFQTFLTWDMLNIIRKKLEDILKEKAIQNSDIDATIMIINELLENVCKHTPEKNVTLQVFKYNNKIIIETDNSTNKMEKNKLKELKEEIKRVNSYTDLNQLMLDSIARSATLNPDESKLGFSLIRKISKGSKIKLKKSNIYNPGIAIEIVYNQELKTSTK